jgi:predicted Zn-dependent protease
MWDDAARSNEAAYALSKEWHEPDLHSLSWLEYIYLQEGRKADAKALIAELEPTNEHARHIRESMQVRYAAETGEMTAFEFTDPTGRALRAIAEKRFADAERAIKEEESETEQHELRALLADARGNTDNAFREARLAIKSEESLGVPSGPPDDFKPANELYGELLLKAGRRKEALEQFRASLLRTPNRALSLAGAERSQRLSQ